MSLLKSSEWTAAGSYTWTVPTAVYLVWATILGAGGGGDRDLNASVAGGPGGGAGEQVSMMPLKVTPAATVAVVVGAKGAGGFYANHTAPSGGSIAAIGGNSSFGIYTALGGGNFQTGSVSQQIAGYGGGTRGGLRGNSTTVLFSDTYGKAESPRWFGGAGGGAYADPNISPGQPGMNGGPSGGQLFGGTGGAIVAGAPVPGPGGGGAATLFGAGGNGGDDYTNGNVAAVTGTGGGGAGGTNKALGVGPFHDGAAGYDGYVCVFWIQP